MFALSKTAFFALVDDGRQAFKISGMWMGIYAVFSLFPTFLQLAFGLPEGPESVGPNSAINYIAFIIMVVCGISLYVLGASNIAIAWHRLQLQNRKHKGYFWFDYDGPWWSYYWWAGVVGFVGGLAGIPLLLPWVSGWITDFDDAIPLLGMASAIALFISMQLSLILPAIAIGKHEQTFFSSWALTGPIWMEVLTASVLLAALTYVRYALFDADFFYEHPAWAWLSLALKLVFDWSILLLGISLLTTLYGRLVLDQRPS